MNLTTVVGGGREAACACTEPACLDFKNLDLEAGQLG